MVHIRAKQVLGNDLKPGDLFSHHGDMHWKLVNANAFESIGEKVYIRTNQPLPESELLRPVWKITIEVYDVEDAS